MQMNEKMRNDILNLAGPLREEVARFLCELVRIPSPSCQEEQVIARIRREMESVGFDEIRLDGLGSVIGRIGNGPRVIAMDAHVDTVDVGNRDLWSFDPFAGELRNGRVWGRGAADQKGGMAALVYAGKIVKELGLAQDITLLVTGTVMEEDCDGLCWQHLIREEKITPEVCVLTEPTGCRVYRGHRGRMEIEVEVSGVSAHASAPERGDNAIYRMTEVVRGIEQLNSCLASDEFLGKGSVTVTEIKGSGPSLCAVPDSSRIHLDRRLTWGETRESALAEIRAIVDRCEWACEDDTVKVVVPRYEKRAYTGKVYPADAVFPAWRLETDHPAVLAAVQTHRELFGADTPGADKWTFSTNGVAICGMHGIPCVGFGPGHEEQAHAPDEFCPVDELVRSVAFYAGFALKHCGSS
jgi:putative selenium metabolism hydrolase